MVRGDGIHPAAPHASLPCGLEGRGDGSWNPSRTLGRVSVLVHGQRCGERGWSCDMTGSEGQGRHT